MKAVGLKIKSGYAVAVILTMQDDGPALEGARTVALSAADFPQSRFPYHPTIELPKAEGAALSQRAVREVRCVAAKELGGLLEQARGVRQAGIVVGSTIDPDKLGNPHVRVHALEGKLFREVVVETLRSHGISCAVLVEREAYRKVAADVGATEQQLRNDIAALGAGKAKPWRAEEKLATLAAWWRLQITRAAPV